jgi:hypothetical protein
MTKLILGFFSPWIAYGIITLLHLVLPGLWIKGYVTNRQTGEALRYRLNGILVLALSVGLWLLLGVLNLVSLRQAEIARKSFMDFTGGKINTAVQDASELVLIENTPAARALAEAQRIAQAALDEYWADRDRL